ncbi:putative RNA-binding protein, partial [Pseudoloma neurophilia]
SKESQAELIKQTIELYHSKDILKNTVDLTNLQNHDEICVFETFFSNLFEQFENNKNFGYIVKKKGKNDMFFSYNLKKLQEIPLFITNDMVIPLNTSSTVSLKTNDFKKPTAPVSLKTNDLKKPTDMVFFNSFNETLDKFFELKTPILKSSKRDKIKQAQLIYIQQLIREKDYFFEIGKIIEIDQQLSEI